MQQLYLYLSPYFFKQIMKYVLNILVPVHCLLSYETRLQHEVGPSSVWRYLQEETSDFFSLEI